MTHSKKNIKIWLYSAMDHATAVSTSRRGDTEFDLLVLHFVIDGARTTVKTT